MRSCGACGGALMRVSRVFPQKLFYHAVFNCRDCGRRETHDYWFLFPFGAISQCPSCGSASVEKLRGVDRIDPIYRNPLSYLQKYLGGKIHRCPLCRLQFYDRRKKRGTGS